MAKVLRFLAAMLVALPLFAHAQRTYSQAQLEQLLAPIAAYQEPLLSQVLMAATFPNEVGEAARWSRANPGLQGEAAVRAARDEAWDPSVQALVAFPQVLAYLDANPGWTRSLGEAFLIQEPQVMSTVSRLRQEGRSRS